jgi:hypothetical protein
MHLFGHNFDHDYYFELLDEEERAAQSISRCSTAHHRLSYNAGVVKYVFSTLLHPLREERHFALVEGSAIPTKARS